MHVQSGDLLCFRGHGWWSRLIRLKTWSIWSHVEVVEWPRPTPFLSTTLAARTGPGNGVRRYPSLPPRATLDAVLRPLKPFDWAASRAWFDAEADGQAYDYLGLLRFFAFGRQSTNKQFCSELATRLYRAGGFEPFTPEVDADLVAPGTFRYSPHFRRVWPTGPPA